MWTLDELVDRVRAALTAQYPGVPNGRVRDVPDKRAIRWYATTGLVDRPAAMRGRTALYGPRHLLQLVAVKRLQAAGRSLADIQAALTGAPDTTLAEIADVPAHLLTITDLDPFAATTRPRFWAATAAPPAPTAGARPPTDRGVLGAVDLGGGAILVLARPPSAVDRAALTAAARPLLDLLAARGLLTSANPAPAPEGGDPGGAAPPGGTQPIPDDRPHRSPA